MGARGVGTPDDGDTLLLASAPVFCPLLPNSKGMWGIDGREVGKGARMCGGVVVVLVGVCVVACAATVVPLSPPTTVPLLVVVVGTEAAPIYFVEWMREDAGKGFVRVESVEHCSWQVRQRR